MDRMFLGWDRPILAAAADVILPTASSSGLVDLSDLLIVVPGRGATRRLLELLVQKTGGRLQPPRIVTSGALPELLYEPKLPFAGDLTQKLAWIEALRSLTPQEASQIVRDLPPEQDFAGWLSLADLLQYHHRELAAFNVTFAAAARAGRDVQGETEHARWLTLSQVQERYLAVLDRLQLWDRQTARLEAIRRRECQTQQSVYLVATPDLDTIFCRMLDQITERVKVLVGAPAELADRFDDYGRVVPDAWQNVTIGLTSNQVSVVDGPQTQAEEVVRALARLEGRYGPDEITIGMPDEGLVPDARRLLRECGIPTRWFVAQQLNDSAPCRLVSALAELLEEGSVSAFAEFVRHPDVSAWLSRQRVGEEWLTKLDAYIQENVPAVFPPNRFPDNHDGRIVRRVVEGVERLCRPLSGMSRPLTGWGAPILDVLMQVYAGVELDSSLPGHAAVLTAAERIQEAIARLGDIPEELVPPVPAATAIHLILREIGSEPLPTARDPEAIELLGWLELPLDDAPALVVTTVNEGFVPQSVNADPLLPDQLRAHLGIVDNRRRYARDAYALSVLMHSRPSVHLIAGRRDRRGDPLIPSRLLLAADADEAARRILDFYETDHPAAAPLLIGQLAAERDRHSFSIPKPRGQVEPPASIRVTALREFLASPYRYYLRHVAGLQALDDYVDEMGAQSFGNLAHAVLAKFGRSELKDATDPLAIREFLSRTLDDEATAYLGSSRCVAVDVQLEQLRLRFEPFADWQAAHAAEGWSIEYVEQDCQCDPFDVGEGKSVRLTARIDRVDRHLPSGRWAIYDYKTSEAAKPPEKTHRSRGEWIDLQLPLYRLLARSIGVAGDVQLGYLQVSPDASVMEALANWTEVELADAEERARAAVREILDGRFWKTLEKPPRLSREFDPICQEGVFEREAVV
jgi:ATP-dependent helicase/nuclease subunit B